MGCSPWGRQESDTTDFTFTFHFHALEEEMAAHSSVLAWRIPGTAEPGGLPDVCGVAQGQTRLKRLSSSSLYFYRYLKVGNRIDFNGVLFPYPIRLIFNYLYWSKMKRELL